MLETKAANDTERPTSWTIKVYKTRTADVLQDGGSAVLVFSAMKLDLDMFKPNVGSVLMSCVLYVVAGKPWAPENSTSL